MPNGGASVFRPTRAASIAFGPRRVGGEEPILIVAEVGVNHNGDRELGIRQLRAAVEAGADAVKFQSFRADEIATTWAPSADYQLAGSAQPSQHEMLRQLELDEADLAALFAEGRRLGAIVFTTPFDPVSARMSARLGAPWMKIPSGEVTNHDLVATVGATGLPTIVSTGACAMDEIRAAVAVHGSHGGGPLLLMHCVSSYPAPLDQMNLRAIPTLAKEFGVPVGLSDHSLGRDAAVAAVALGACAIEKHFTIDRTLPGPDHAMSMEPTELADMVRVLRQLERGGLGSGLKAPVAAELPIRDVVRRSVVAAVDIPIGTTLTRALLALKRPGTGMAPEMLETVVGMRAKRDLRADELISLDDLERGKASGG